MNEFAAVQAPISAQTPVERVKILLVDDKPEKLLALEAVLDDLGQQIVRAYSGRDALRCLLNDDFASISADGTITTNAIATGALTAFWYDVPRNEAPIYSASPGPVQPPPPPTFNNLTAAPGGE